MSPSSAQGIGEAGAALPYLPTELSARPRPDIEPPPAVNVGVRAYLITGGRASAQLGYETMLSADPVAPVQDVQFERASILDACRGPALSVAEISVHTSLAIGVVRVLAADLVDEGLLIAYHGGSDKASDVTLLTNLIAGFRAL